MLAISQNDLNSISEEKLNVLQAAVDSNNAGVSFMEMARYDEALEVLRSAADLMYVITQLLKVSNTGNQSLA
jgi:hypothetical protein